MEHYRYLIIGGGMTAAAAVEGIRAVDASGTIGLVSAETDPPYDRPPLTKGLWTGKPLDTIWRDLNTTSVETHLGRRVLAVDPTDHRVALDHNTDFRYDRLLLATGGRPRRLGFGDKQVVYFRTLANYRRLRAMVEEGKRFAVIGGGFIGSEIAAALTMNGGHATMVFPGDGIGGRTFPAELSRFVTEYYVQKGVEVLTNETAERLETQGGRYLLGTAAGRELMVDGVVAGIGIEPSTELAQAAGLVVGDGIVVDEQLRTSDADIFAAGDVASFYYPVLAKRMRVEHEDNANSMGRAAGRNMAGEGKDYDHLPLVYSDMFDLGYEAVGELDARLETFADWSEPNRKGVIYYLQDGRVRGVLLWNVWGQADAARGLIAQAGPFTVENLRGRLPAPDGA